MIIVDKAEQQNIMLNMMVYRCDSCDMSMKSNKCLQQHLKCKRHVERISKPSPARKYECGVCGKKFPYRQSLHTHKKTCAATINSVQNETSSIQAQIDDMKEAFEKERKEMKIAFEESKKEQVIKNNKRKKINKVTRQMIAEKQENRCGDCKLALSPYFELDHIIGLQFGGTDEESNLMALCRECHAKKSITENQCRKQIQDAIQTILKGKERNTNVIDEDLRKRVESCEKELKEFRVIFAQFLLKRNK